MKTGGYGGGDLNYSIDMMRIRSRVSCENPIWIHFVQMMQNEPNSEFWYSSSLKKYRYNWHIIQQDPFGNVSGYKVNYLHNSEKSGSAYKVHWLSIEYNPSKVYYDDILKYLLVSFFQNEFQIKSCDVAIDISDVNIDSITVDAGYKQSYKEFRTSKGTTKYYGDNIKVYDKARELGLENKELTRYEISIDVDLSNKSISREKIVLGEIMKLFYVQPVMIQDATLRALYFAVMQGYSINELSRVYRKKIEELLKQSSTIEISEEKIKNCVCEYVRKLEKDIELITNCNL